MTFDEVVKYIISDATDAMCKLIRQCKPKLRKRELLVKLVYVAFPCSHKRLFVLYASMCTPAVHC